MDEYNSRRIIFGIVIVLLLAQIASTIRILELKSEFEKVQNELNEYRSVKTRVEMFHEHLKRLQGK